MGGDDSGVVGITLRELLTEMRDEIRALRSVVDSVARDEALLVERRSTMQRVADTITGRLYSHEKAILDLQRWRDEGAPHPSRTTIRNDQAVVVQEPIEEAIHGWIKHRELARCVSNSGVEVIGAR